jgi:bifunctional DNA-binding transcriptional regulator/antitoxin component of YhaV-PrlF toxin-antitoxin module
MNLVKLGKKGQVSIPRSTLRELGITDEQMLTVEATEDGAIVLRPAGVYPLELYDDARIAEFLAEDEVPADLKERIDAATSAKS